MDAGLHVLALTLKTNADSVADFLRSAGPDASFSPLATLAATRTLSLVIDDTMRAVVTRARSEGSTWQDIGDVLGTTRQAAYQRFGHDAQGDNAAMTTPIEGADTRAIDILTRYFARDWTIREQFDETMTDRLGEELLAASFEQVKGLVGEFKSLGEPAVRVHGQHAVVDVPLAYSGGDMKGRVVFDADGRVTGFFILHPDAD
jgi:hypothetical protein